MGHSGLGGDTLMGAVRSWGYSDTLCCVGYLLQTGVSCHSSLWGWGAWSTGTLTGSSLAWFFRRSTRSRG